jgi:hypothetical protein
MPEKQHQEFAVGPLRITVEHRKTPDDEGPAVRVFGFVGNQEKQLLRFDCFLDDPHYHYDPDGKNELHHMNDEGIVDPVEWTLHRLERNLSEMIRRAGFGSLADQVERTPVAEQVLPIQEALMVVAV